MIGVIEKEQANVLQKPVCFITPINFAHKAGDGVKTRKHNATQIHPSLQANCGGSQMTFLLELWSCDK